MRERSPGVWQLRVSAGADPVTGKHKILTATFRGNKTAARKALAELNVKHRQRAGSAGTVAEMVASWMLVAPIGDTTRDVYVFALAHLPPAWRKRKAEAVRYHDVVALYRHLTASGVGAATVRKLHAVLSGAFTHAVRQGHLVGNPCTRAELPPVERSTRPPTDAELVALFDAATDQEAILLTVAIAVGGRRGEMVSLRWVDHLDLEQGRIRIQESTTTKGKVKSTKTGNDELLPLAPDVVAVLKAWRLAQMERSIAAGVSYSLRAFVLSDAMDSGRPWRPNLATSRFIALRKRAGVTGVRLQDMRHVTATTLLEAGVDIVTVSKHMRHSRVSTTANVYAWVRAGKNEQVASVLGDVVKRARR